MVESTTVKKASIEFANLCQSLHIGINNYAELKEVHFPSDLKSHNDVDKLKDFFKNQLHYHRVMTMKDERQMNKIN